jgi:rhodanese-related sulfurtransferase
MLDKLKVFRKFLFFACATIGLSPYFPEPFIVQKLRCLMSGVANMQPQDWLDLSLYGLPWVLLILSFLPTKKSKKMQEVIKSGACSIIDVRTRGEFMGGHVAGSKNIPLQELGKHLEEIHQMPQPIILCCASGMRSGQAASLLSQQGIECYNGGSWLSVNAQTA